MELQQSNPIIRSGFSNKNEWKYDIDKENKGIILHILRNQLYSDKIRAVLREYGTNAADAHITAKVKIPFQVILPTALNPQLHIRDFGKGLSPTQVEKTYIKLGKSTKRASNLLNGCLGLGSKSGFAYSDTFQIVSYYGGKKITYLAYIDESREGRLNMVQEDVTTETGIEIIIPSDVADITKFRLTAIQVFGVFDKPPRVLTHTGHDDTTNNQTLFSYFTANSPKQKQTVHLSSHYKSNAIMGNVEYPINLDLLNLPNLLSVGYSIKCPLGSIDFTASREALEYTEKTINTLKTAIINIHKEFDEKLQAKIDKLDDWWKMKRLLIGVSSGKKAILHNQPNERRLIKKEYVWKGETVNFRAASCADFMAYKVTSTYDEICWNVTTTTLKPRDKVFYTILPNFSAVNKLQDKINQKTKYRIANYLAQKMLLITGRTKHGLYIILNKEDPNEIKKFQHTFNPAHTIEIELPSIKKHTRAKAALDFKEYIGYPIGLRWKQRKPVNLKEVEPGVYYPSPKFSDSNDIQGVIHIFNKANEMVKSTKELFIVEGEKLDIPDWEDLSQFLAATVFKNINTHLVAQTQALATRSYGGLSQIKALDGIYIQEAIEEISQITEAYSEINDHMPKRSKHYLLKVSLQQHKEQSLKLLKYYPMLQYVEGYLFNIDVAQQYVSQMDQLHQKESKTIQLNTAAHHITLN